MNPALTRAGASVVLALLTGPTLLAAQIEVGGVDLYGSSQITLDDVRLQHGATLDSLLASASDGRRDRARELYEQLKSEIGTMGDFAFVDVAFIAYPGDGRMYVTIDLVDEADRGSRMTFSPQPSGDVPDPSGLLGAWVEYEERSLGFIQAGSLGPDFPDCPVHHCIGGFGHPLLERFLPLFNQGVREEEEQLALVLREHANEGARAAAAYLLAHLEEGQRVVDLLAPAALDPSATVRNSVLRVLGVISVEQEGIVIPLDPILTVLGFPDTSDRNKALLVLTGLARLESNRERILSEAGDVLLANLRLQQPNTHANALGVLRALSAQDFGGRDNAAWEAWLAAQGNP